MANQAPDNPDRDRIEREVEDILRAKDFGTGPSPAPRSRPRPAPRSRGNGLERLKPRSPVQVMIAGGILLLLEYVGVLRFLGGLAGIFGLFLLLLGVVTYFMRPTGTRKYWRGELIEMPEDHAWTARLYRFIYRT